MANIARVGVAHTPSDAKLPKGGSITLLNEEVARYGEHPGIVTVTFFDGPYKKIRETLSEKFREVLKQNPWLCGTVKDKKTIVYPGGAEIQDSHVDSIFKEIKPESLSATDLQNFDREKASYPAMNKTCLQICSLGTCKEMIKSQMPISQARLIKTSDKNTFGKQECAFLFGLSHYVADGHTYYKVMNMFGIQQEVIQLEPKRVSQKQYTDTEKSLSTPDMLKYQNGSRFIKHFVWNNILAKSQLKRDKHADGKSQSGLFFVNEQHVKDRKDGALRQTRRYGLDPRLHKVSFISTNDILVHDFAIASNADIVMQTVNYRKYSAGKFTDLHAGNYENVILYDREGYSSAGHIRASITPENNGGALGKISKKSLPGICSRVKFGFVSSWAFNFDFEIMDILSSLSTNREERIHQLLHLPIMKLTAGSAARKNPLDTPCDFCIIFYPQPRKLGVLLVTKNVAIEDFLHTGGSVLDDPILYKQIFNNDVDQ